MEQLLKKNYTTHYRLPQSSVANIYQETDAVYFEITDDNNKETQISFSPNSGQAVYQNPNQYLIGIINYDKFVTSLPQYFQDNRRRCDLLIYTVLQPCYFLLNELKDANPVYGASKATLQLEKSLTDLLAVPEIKDFINKFSVKKCCFFNKRELHPLPLINAESAFNQPNTIENIPQNGFIMQNTIMESFGFTHHIFYGGNQFILH